jgi:cation/acetate symporter
MVARLPRVVGALAAVAVSFVYLVVQIYGVGLIASHLTGFGFDLGIFVGLGGVLVCSFLGGMRAVTWTQVAQYLVLILAYLVPLTWLSVQQTGSPLPVLSHGTQLMQIAKREGELQPTRPNWTWRGGSVVANQAEPSCATCAVPWLPMRSA